MSSRLEALRRHLVRSWLSRAAHQVSANLRHPSNRDALKLEQCATMLLTAPGWSLDAAAPDTATPTSYPPTSTGLLMFTKAHARPTAFAWFEEGSSVLFVIVTHDVDGAFTQRSVRRNKGQPESDPELLTLMRTWGTLGTPTFT